MWGLRNNVPVESLYLTVSMLSVSLGPRIICLKFVYYQYFMSIMSITWTLLSLSDSNEYIRDIKYCFTLFQLVNGPGPYLNINYVLQQCFSNLVSSKPQLKVMFIKQKAFLFILHECCLRPKKYWKLNCDKISVQINLLRICRTMQIKNYFFGV